MQNLINESSKKMKFCYRNCRVLTSEFSTVIRHFQILLRYQTNYDPTQDVRSVSGELFSRNYFTKRILIRLRIRICSKSLWTSEPDGRLGHPLDHCLYENLKYKNLILI